MQVRRGTLLLEIDDSRWAAALRGLLPGLAARLAGRFPEIGVRRFAIVRPDDPTATRTEPLAETARSTEDPPSASEAAPVREEPSRPVPSLEAVAEAYLARARSRDGRPSSR